MGIHRAFVIELGHVSVSRGGGWLLIRHKDRELSTPGVSRLHQFVAFLVTVVGIANLSVFWFFTSLPYQYCVIAVRPISLAMSIGVL